MTPILISCCLLFASQDTEPIPIDEVDILQVHHSLYWNWTGVISDNLTLIYWTNEGPCEIRGVKHIWNHNDASDWYTSHGGYIMWDKNEFTYRKPEVIDLRVIRVGQIRHTFSIPTTQPGQFKELRWWFPTFEPPSIHELIGRKELEQPQFFRRVLSGEDRADFPGSKAY